MEFAFNIHHCLPSEISVLQSADIALEQPRKGINDRDSNRFMLSKIIDEMGAGSAKAQGLHSPITTSLKLKSSNDKLYIMKDLNNGRNNGKVVGMMRIGSKRLFLRDMHGQQFECQPKCVLDFYVHESLQRYGYGKKIFDFVLQRENNPAYQLAIDRPSNMFLNFLSKHYGLNKPLHQINNFVVYQMFFKDLAAVGVIDRYRRKSAPNRREIYLMERPSSRKVNSATARTSNTNLDGTGGMMDHHSILKDIQVSNNYTSSNLSTPLSSKLYTENQRYSKKRVTFKDYSRHEITSPPQENNIASKSVSPAGLVTTSSSCTKKIPSPTNLQSISSPAYMKNVTSSDNPLALQERINTCDLAPAERSVPANIARCNQSELNDKTMRSKENVDSKQDYSYTVGQLDERKRFTKDVLGTGWNILGVPASRYNSSKNPYAKMQR